MFGFNYNRMNERIGSIKYHNTSSKITLEFCANPEAVDMTIKDWLKNNNFTKINSETKNNKYINGKEKTFQYTVSIDYVIIYAYYGGESTNVSLKSMLNLPGAEEAEKYGIEIYGLLKLINNLSLQNGFEYNTFTFENSEYNFENFEKDWINICEYKKRECAQRALDYCLISFAGAAAFIFGKSIIPELLSDETMILHDKNLRASGITLFAGGLFLYIGCMMSLKYAFVAVKTNQKKLAILAIVINILLVAACIVALIFTILGKKLSII